MKKYAELIKKIDMDISPERAAKCGYDLFMGLEAKDVDDRYKAWKDYIIEVEEDEPHTQEERNGVWVPAIPL